MEDNIISEVNVQGSSYGLACSLIKGTCSSASDAWVKVVDIPSSALLLTGMLISVQFEHGNTVGEAEEQTLYSSDQEHWYTNSAMTREYTVAPAANRDIKYTGTDNIYKYYSFPLIQIRDKTLKLKDSRGHYAGKGCYNDNDKMLLFYDGDDVCIQNSDVRQVSVGYKVMSDGTKEYTKQYVDSIINAATYPKLNKYSTGFNRQSKSAAYWGEIHAYPGVRFKGPSSAIWANNMVSFKIRLAEYDSGNTTTGGGVMEFLVFTYLYRPDKKHYNSRAMSIGSSQRANGGYAWFGAGSDGNPTILISPVAGEPTLHYPHLTVYDMQVSINGPQNTDLFDYMEVGFYDSAESGWTTAWSRSDKAGSTGKPTMSAYF